MDNSLVVGCPQGVGDLGADRKSVLQRQGGLLRLEGLAVDEFHCNEIRAFELFDAVDGTDVGMIEGRRGLGFLDEPGRFFSCGRHLIREEFQRDHAIECEVPRLVHDAHAPLAQFLKDLIVRYPLTDHAGVPSRMSITMSANSVKTTEFRGNIKGLMLVAHAGSIRPSPKIHPHR